MNIQVTNKVFMVKPIRFNYNKETAKDNIYQKTDQLEENKIQERALREFNLFANKLEKEGIQVNIIQDTLDFFTPDSIFPNNWFSSHEKEIVFYPMYSKNRRKELEKFKKLVYDLADGKNKKIIDYSKKCKENIFLEGTGSLVLDRKNKKAYCAISNRSNKKLFLKFCKDLGYKPLYFKAYQDGHLVYHTNVLMGIGEKIAIICLEAIKSLSEREKVKKELLSSDKKIIEISLDQVKNFLGNVLELKGNKKNFLIMSETAYENLSSKQKREILKYIKILTANVKTIEFYGGGSVRCMVGEIF